MPARHQSPSAKSHQCQTGPRRRYGLENGHRCRGSHYHQIPSHHCQTVDDILSPEQGLHRWYRSALKLRLCFCLWRRSKVAQRKSQHSSCCQRMAQGGLIGVLLSGPDAANTECIGSECRQLLIWRLCIQLSLRRRRGSRARRECAKEEGCHCRLRIPCTVNRRL